MARYNKDIVKQITDLIKLDSYTIYEICKIVKISQDTYHQWIKHKPEFSDAVKKAKNSFKLKLLPIAKNSMLKKIEGYSVEETKTVYVDDKDKDGKLTGKPKIKEKTVITKHFQPDTALIIFFLCNAEPEEWKNRNQYQQELPPTEAKKDFDLNNVPEDLLLKVADSLQDSIKKQKE